MYKTNKTKFIEVINTWKESELGEAFYRDANHRVDIDEGVIYAPWAQADADAINEAADASPFASCWQKEEDAEAFMEAADALDEEDFVEFFASSGAEQNVIEAIFSQLESNENRIMLVAPAGSTEGYAVAFSEGTFFISEMELDEELLDEGLISIGLIAAMVDPNAPVVPGFPMVEAQNSLYETLHSAALLSMAVAEDAELEGSQLFDVLEAFTADLAEVISEVALDPTLTEEELSVVVDVFKGAYAGIFESVYGTEKQND